VTAGRQGSEGNKVGGGGPSRQVEEGMGVYGGTQEGGGGWSPINDDIARKENIQMSLEYPYPHPTPSPRLSFLSPLTLTPVASICALAPKQGSGIYLSEQA
jgi:hypothetical protein